MTDLNLQHKTYFVQEEFKKWSVSSLFMALTVMAMVLMSPISSSPTRGVIDNLQNIWDSPTRIETIEADINEINERLSVMKLDGDRIITSELVE